MVKLYRELAKYYDKIYHWKDYRKEAKAIKGLIQDHKQSSGSDLLDVGCGTGKHLQYLRDDFCCVGLDINEEMLRIARRNVDGAKFVKANMTDFNLKRRFDVALCLFSSMGY